MLHIDYYEYFKHIVDYENQNKTKKTNPKKKKIKQKKAKEKPQN